MSYLFHHDTYDTAGDRRDRLSRLLLDSRVNFFLRICANFYRIGSYARKGGFDRQQQIASSENNVKILERCGAQIHLRGLDNLTLEPGPFVLAGNHMSAVETIMLNAIVSPRLDFTYVIKNGLFAVPFMRQAMKAVNAIGVDQKNPREDFKVILESGRRHLTSGRSVLIFPEAARCRDFRPERFNSIAVKLARSVGVKIIPFALKTDFLSLGRLFTDFGPIHPERHIHFEFGAPLAITGSGRETQEQIIEFISERCRRWNHQVTSPLPYQPAAIAAK